jgi:hypothetical protein
MLISFLKVRRTKLGWGQMGYQTAQIIDDMKSRLP